MQYTLILTETAEGGIQVTIPALPACRVEAATRDDAIRLAREAPSALRPAASGGARSAAGSPTPLAHPTLARGEKVRLHFLSP